MGSNRPDISAVPNSLAITGCAAVYSVFFVDERAIFYPPPHKRIHTSLPITKQFGTND